MTFNCALVGKLALSASIDLTSAKRLS